MIVPDDEFREQYQYLIDEMKAGDSWRIFRILAEFVSNPLMVIIEDFCNVHIIDFCLNIITIKRG